MQNNIYIYIAIMVIVTTLIRVIPLTLIRKEITTSPAMMRSFLAGGMITARNMP